ncbi:MAG TPA: N-acetylmuramoyl-L-alanine amidase [Acidimicrobiales bacterium]
MTGSAPSGRRGGSAGLVGVAGALTAVVLALVAAVAVVAPDASAVPARSARGAAPHVTTSTHLIVASATDPATGGYWLTATDGGVFSFGAPFEGSAGALPLRSPVVGMAPTAGGLGYRLVAADGGVFAYGDAAFLGSMGGLPLNRPVVGMAATPDGAGYWLVASDGGIFAYGNAPFLGSMGGRSLNRPIVGMATTPDGLGYWLVASDGGIFAYGDARFQGSTGNLVLTSPVVGMAPDSPSGGYRLVAADGGVFCFGAPFSGSAVGLLQRAAVSVDGWASGYRVVSADGSVYAFGGAPFLGSVSVPPLVGEVVTIDPGHDGGNGSDPGFINRPIDGGGFIEACDTAGTDDVNGYPEHAFNFDVAVRLAAALDAGGATVVLTHYNDTGVGPCVNTRAAIGNAARSDAAVSIHGDGGPPGGSGFAVDVPVPVVSAISDNRAIVAPSGVLGTDVRDRFLADTGLHVSDYAGVDGIVPRSDLGGLDLSTVPKVLIECGNMQNPGNASIMEDAGWRQRAALGLADGITAFLVQREVP